MTEDSFDSQDPVDADLAAFLAEPSMWDELDPAVEDAIVAAIAEERDLVAPVIAVDARRRWVTPLLAGAAVVVLVAGLLVTFLRDDTVTPEIELALDATDLAPSAEGLVEIDTTPLGTRLILDVSGLPPAPAGQYYEAWLRTGPDVGVSAGTFHLRGGDGRIELWAGVTIEDYPLFTITIQDEADPTSSGRVVLKGLVE
ncbi:MAG: anti-sigma factor [Acidimicrobiales bacterium]|nr:anti-sigma factor [Acidimicrobiales bacterium]